MPRLPGGGRGHVRHLRDGVRGCGDVRGADGALGARPARQGGRRRQQVRHQGGAVKVAEGGGPGAPLVPHSHTPTTHGPAVAVALLPRLLPVHRLCFEWPGPCLLGDFVEPDNDVGCLRGRLGCAAAVVRAGRGRATSSTSSRASTGPRCTASWATSPRPRSAAARVPSSCSARPATFSYLGRPLAGRDGICPIAMFDTYIGGTCAPPRPLNVPHPPGHPYCVHEGGHEQNKPQTC